MTEAQRLSPKPENEIANQMTIACDMDLKRLNFMKEETEILLIAAENARYISPYIKRKIIEQLDRQEEINMELESHLEIMKERLEEMGVSLP